MAYIRQKIISNQPYLYEQENKREGGKVVTHHVRYIGSLAADSSQDNNNNLGTTSHTRQLTEEELKDISLITKAKQEVFSDRERKLAIKATERLYEKGLDTRNQYFNKDEKKYGEERAQLHEKIEQDFLNKPESVVPIDKKPEVILLGGAPGSGKSSAILNKFDKKKYVVIDSDEIKKLLPEYKGYNASLLHDESSDVFEKIKETAMVQRKNIILDATLKNTAKAREAIDIFKQFGYDVKLYGTQLSKEDTLSRATHRAISKGRYVPAEYVVKNTDKINQSVKDLTRYVNEYKVYDTSEFGNPKLVLEGTNQG